MKSNKKFDVVFEFKQEPLIRPGDVVRIIINNCGAGKKGSEHIVVKGCYTNGIPRFVLPHYAWLYANECKFVRKASDREFLRALNKAEGF